MSTIKNYTKVWEAFKMAVIAVMLMVVLAWCVYVIGYIFWTIIDAWLQACKLTF